MPDQYWENKPGTKRLVGPAYIVRLSFLMDISLAVAIFIYCAYFTIVDRIVESKIEYDPISGYECRNLAPRNSAITLSSSNSEEVDFSSSRFLLNECLNNLSSTGYDVCGDDNLNKVITNSRYITSERSSGSCIDLLFSNGQRACIGKDVTHSETNSYTSTFAINAPPSEVTSLLSLQNQYLYFMNESWQKGFDINDIYQNFKSDFINVGPVGVGVLASITSSPPGGATTMKIVIADPLQDALEFITLPSTFHDIYGFAGNSDGSILAVMTMSISYIATLFVYNRDSATSYQRTIDCNQYFKFTSSTPLVQNTPYTRFISFGDDDALYMICSSSTYSTQEIPGPGPPTTITYANYPLLKFNAVDDIFDKVYYINFYNMDTTNVTRADGSRVNIVSSVTQIIVANQHAYALVDHTILLDIDLANQPTPEPTAMPTFDPTTPPTTRPTRQPTPPPIRPPTALPTASPSAQPTEPPSASPSASPTRLPTRLPTKLPTTLPTAIVVVRKLTNVIDSIENSGDIRIDVISDVTFSPKESFDDTSHDNNNNYDSSSSNNNNISRRLTTVHYNVSGMTTQPISYAGLFSIGALQKSNTLISIATTTASTSAAVVNYHCNYDCTSSPQIYDPNTDQVSRLTSLNDEYKLYYAVEIGYYYGLCNGNVTHYAMAYGTTSGFASACGEKNGIYYQNNSWHAIPSSCVSSLQSSGVDSIYDCPEFKTYWTAYIEEACASKSIALVCKQSYSSNSPFFCSRYVKNNFITVASTAFANAGAFRGIWIILVIWIFGRLFPEEIDFSERLHAFSKGIADAKAAIDHEVHDLKNAAKQAVHDIKEGFDDDWMGNNSKVYPVNNDVDAV